MSFDDGVDIVSEYKESTAVTGSTMQVQTPLPVRSGVYVEHEVDLAMLAAGGGIAAASAEVDRQVRARILLRSEIGAIAPNDH